MFFVAATLFDRDGVTKLANLPRAKNITWTDELSAEGSFSFVYENSTIGGDYLDNLDVNSIGYIVKFSYGNDTTDYVWAGVIESLTEDISDDNYEITVSGRGLRCLLENAIVYNEETEKATRIYKDINVGEIMVDLMTEAQARSTLTELTLGFTITEDSNNVSWTSAHELNVEYRAGTSYLEVANGHSETVVDVWITPNMVFEYAITRGTDTTATSTPVVLRMAQNIVDLSREVQGPVKNVILTEYGAEKFLYTVDSTSVSQFGKRESYLSLQNIGSSQVAQRITDKAIPIMKNPAKGITVEVLPEGYLPYTDYNVGDYVYINDQDGNRTKYRVTALTVNVDGENVRVIPELGTTRARLERRLARLIQRQESKSANGEMSVTASAPDYNFQQSILGEPKKTTGTPTGKWRALAYRNISGSQAFTNNTANYGTIFFSLFEIDHEFTLDAFGVVTTGTSATAKLRVGIYDELEGRPYTLLIDAGQIDCTTAGAKTKTFTNPAEKILTPGNYWVAVVWQQAQVGTLSISGYNIFGGGMYMKWHDSIQHATTAGASNPTFTSNLATYTTGGLPDVLAQTDLKTWTTTNGYGYGPAVALRHK